ncbi:hypothetical protein [Rhizobium sp. Rhizsp82]|uniref:hypothetical protein n=1 Tax=Rhizobium sp. Rhizsp82 TaxID=3243057 RepID=UPI0039B4BFE8
MATSYKFSVIQARPDAMRGERVNVGVVVHGPRGLEVRMPEIRKLAHLTGHRWEKIADAYRHSLERTADQVIDDLRGDTGLSRRSIQSEVFILGRPGEIRAKSEDEYELAVKRILTTFVEKPTLSRTERQQRINTEITAMLRQVGVLARRGQKLEDGKVITRFTVSEEKDIVADFAYKSGKLKVVSTLELRGISGAVHAKACEKGATLYFAKQRFGDEVKPLGVFAATSEEAEVHKGEIEILKSFADGNAFNWMDAQDQQKFKAALY